MSAHLSPRSPLGRLALLATLTLAAWLLGKLPLLWGLPPLAVLLGLAWWWLSRGNSPATGPSDTTPEPPPSQEGGQSPEPVARGAFLDVGEDGLVRQASPAAEPIFGLTGAQLAGRPLGRLLEPAHDLTEALTGGPDPRTLQAVHGDGTAVEVEVSAEQAGPGRRVRLRELPGRAQTERLFSTLEGVDRLLERASSLPEVMPALLELVTSGLGMQVGRFWERGSALHLGVPAGLRCTRTWPTDPSLQESGGGGQESAGPLAVRACATGQAAWSADLAGEDSLPQDHGGRGLRAGFAVPVHLGEEVLGVLEFFSRRRLGADLPGALPLLQRRLASFLRRRATEADLRKAVAEAEDLYNRAPCGYHSLDAEGQVVRINDTALSLLGYTRDEVLGRPITDFLTPQGKESFPVNFAAFKARGWLRDHEFQAVRKDGGIVHGLLSSLAVRDSAGRFLMSRSAWIDITGRKEAERRLAETTARLEAVLAASPAKPQESGDRSQGSGVEPPRPLEPEAATGGKDLPQPTAAAPPAPTLPSRTAPATPRPVPVSPASPAGTRSLRVLVVEDNAINQQVLILLLQKFGHQTVVAHNGLEALQMLDRERFDLVLMDLNMPQMDGLRATRLVRQREKAAGTHTPIVAVTAAVMPGERERCLAAGMDDYLSKPVRLPDLQAVLARLGGGRAGSAAGAGEEGEPANEWESALTRLGFDPPALARLVQTFLDTLPARLADLHQSVEQADPAALRKAAHSLKGALQVFSARESAELAQALELRGHEGQTEGAGELLARLEQAVDGLARAMRDYLGRAAEEGHDGGPTEHDAKETEKEG